MWTLKSLKLLIRAKKTPIKKCRLEENIEYYYREENQEEGKTRRKRQNQQQKENIQQTLRNKQTKT